MVRERVQGRAGGLLKRGALALTSASLVAFMVGGTGASAASTSGSPFKSVGGIAAGQTLTGAKPLTASLAQSDPALLHLSGSAMTPVMVKLDYDALGTYSGNIPGLAATSPQVTGHKLDVTSPDAVRYSSHLSSIDAGFLAALSRSVPSAVVGQTYHVVYGGVALRVPADRVAGLLSLPGAVAVQKDALQKPDSFTPVADDDAEFIGGNSAYRALGSSTTAGRGVIVADVDTGVWPEHPSFAARPDLATPPPTPDGHARACNFGTNPLTGVPFTCNNKLIGGQVFLATYNSVAHDEAYPTSARDSNGHGTHTTSTAAGNPLAHASLFGIDRGPIQGIAPGAFVLSYKALGPQGGFDSDLVAAIQQAVKDGADVINYSVGPSSPQSPYTAPDDLAFLDAFNAGVVASTSAGNSGPKTVDHNGPWELSAGATTLQRAFVSTATITSGASILTIQGSAIRPGIGTATPVVNADSVAGYDKICSTPAPPGSFTGKIVVCVRGGVDKNGVAVGRVQKGFNVLHGGAAGMFLINPVVEDTETDNHFLPAVHFDQPAGAQLESFLAAHPGATATFTDGQEANGQGDVLAAFSSTGPGGDFLKPDIAAPGVQVLAGNTPTPSDVASGPPGQLFQAIAGTSMSAPHITGSAALVIAGHPGWTPAEVMSALTTTGDRKVVEPDGHTPAGVFDIGGGRVDLAGAIDPGLTLNVSKKQMDAVLVDPLHRVDLNKPSIDDTSLSGRVTTARIVKNVESSASSYDVAATSTLKGAVTVTPAHFTVQPGHGQMLTITLDGTGGTPGTTYTGSIELVQTNGGHRLHMPLAFTVTSPAAGVVTLATGCDRSTLQLSKRQTSICTVTAQNDGLQPAPVHLSTTWTDNLALTDKSGAIRRDSADKVSLPATTLSAAKPPQPQIAPGASPGGYLDLAQFGASLRPMGDETITNFNVPAFKYAGQTYSALGVVSDGYLVVGGGNTNDIHSNPQHFPDPARPNNVLAPLWTDLDGGAGAIPGQGFRIAVLSADATHSWIVIQAIEHVFGAPTHLETFETWLGINGVEDVSFAYDPAHPVTDPGLPFNIGAENADGTAGSNFAGLPTSDLVVQSTPLVPGGSATYSVTLQGIRTLPGHAGSTVETDLTSPLIRGTTVSIDRIRVLP